MLRFHLKKRLDVFLQNRPWLYAVQGFDGVTYIVEGEYIAIIRQKDALLIHESEIEEVASNMLAPWREELLDIVEDVKDLRRMGVRI